MLHLREKIMRDGVDDFLQVVEILAAAQPQIVDDPLHAFLIDVRLSGDVVAPRCAGLRRMANPR